MRDAAFLIYVHIGHQRGEYNNSSEGYMKLRLKWWERMNEGQRKEKGGKVYRQGDKYLLSEAQSGGL